MEGKYKTRKENLGYFCSNYKHPLQILPFSTENFGWLERKILNYFLLPLVFFSSHLLTRQWNKFSLTNIEQFLFISFL
jgi:hypothetical protein